MRIQISLGGSLMPNLDRETHPTYVVCQKLMPASYDTLVEGALQLSPEDRARLAQALLHSLDENSAEDPLEVERAWRDEIERRMTDVRAGNTAGIPADEVFAKLRAKYG
jgi:putative addiction module component (TIGR02574 family)